MYIYIYVYMYTHLNRKFIFTRHYIYIFWCAWESTSKKLFKSQLDIRILILNIIQLKDLEQIFCRLMKHT